MADLDFNLLFEFMRNMDLATGSSLASLFSFFKQIQEWRENQRRQGQTDTVEKYLEWLRRQDQQQLVDLIIQNQIAFQQLFAGMESSFVKAVRELDANMEKRHIEVASLEVSPADLKITYGGFTSARRFQRDAEWIDETLTGSLTLVNRSNSHLTLSHGSLTIRHGEATHATVLHSTGPIAPNGESFKMKFRTERAVRWRQGETYTPVELTLEFDQTDGPFTFAWQDGKFVPS